MSFFDRFTPGKKSTGSPRSPLEKKTSTRSTGLTISLPIAPKEDKKVEEKTLAALNWVPVLRAMPARQAKGVLQMTVLACAVALIGGFSYTGYENSGNALILRATGDAMLQSQRLDSNSIAVLLGSKSDFDTLRHAAEQLRADLSRIPMASDEPSQQIAKISRTTLDNAQKILESQKVLGQIQTSLQTINEGTADLAAQTQALLYATSTLPGVTHSTLAAVAQLGVLVERLDASVNEFNSPSQGHSDSIDAIEVTLKQFNQIASDLQAGNPTLGIQPLTGQDALRLFNASLNRFTTVSAAAQTILNNTRSLAEAHAAQRDISEQSKNLLAALSADQKLYTQRATLRATQIVPLTLVTALLLLALFLLTRLNLEESQLQAEAERVQRALAEKREREARQINDTNQAAILRLMNELQTISEGDLTQQATVTEDFTGAIADSVNFTIEEIRTLVTQVQSTVDDVSKTTQQAGSQSETLLKASEKQLQEMHTTGEQILQMSARITEMAQSALDSASVAQEALQASARGRSAVHDSINGMSAIRTQIQDTSKRIKRLGESSQEIGEISELISSITEQTNTLALNAAIQAASAGEAGRGFSVVAEEVQRLAERSAEATRQITALVNAIRADTQDAVIAMEKSTTGVVDGARLADRAGEALSEIDGLSKQLAQLIIDISTKSKQEAETSDAVAKALNGMMKITEDSSAGTKTTAELITGLQEKTKSLRDQISRFRLS